VRDNHEFILVLLTYISFLPYILTARDFVKYWVH